MARIAAGSVAITCRPSVTLTAMSRSTSAVIRCGLAAANIAAMAAPSPHAAIAARLDPAASMTAAMSSARCSSVGVLATQSEKPGAALVEENQPPHGRQAIKEPGELRKFPHHLQMRHPAWDEHQVKPAGRTDDLISDINVASPREPCLWQLRHEQPPGERSSVGPRSECDALYSSVASYAAAQPINYMVSHAWA